MKSIIFEKPLTNLVWQSKLEFTLRFQQYIELIRTQDEQKLLDARAHAKKFMLPFNDTYGREVLQAAGLLAVPPGTSVYEVSEPFGALLLFYWAALISSLGPVQPIPLGRHCKTLHADA